MGCFEPCQIIAVKPGMIYCVCGATGKPLLIPFPCQLQVINLVAPEESAHKVQHCRNAVQQSSKGAK